MPLSEVFSPSWVVGVRVASDLDVPADPGSGGVVQRDRLDTAFAALYFPEERPVVAAVRTGQISKVLLLDPTAALVWMSPFGPFPERLEDCRIHLIEDLFADLVSMIDCPSPYQRVELVYEVSRTSRLLGFGTSLSVLLALRSESVSTLIFRVSHLLSLIGVSVRLVMRCSHGRLDPVHGI